jgi:hypothetical protein
MTIARQVVGILASTVPTLPVDLAHLPTHPPTSPPSPVPVWH